MLLKDSLVANSAAKTCTFTDGLSGEERSKDLLLVNFGNMRAVVADSEEYAGVAFHTGKFSIVLRDFDLLSTRSCVAF